MNENRRSTRDTNLRASSERSDNRMSSFLMNFNVDVSVSVKEVDPIHEDDDAWSNSTPQEDQAADVSQNKKYL